MDGDRGDRASSPTTARPRPKVLVLTTFDLDEYVYDGARAPVRAGSCSRTLGRTQLVNGVRVVGGRGRPARAEPITRRLLIETFARRQRPAPRSPRRSSTTCTERETRRRSAGRPGPVRTARSRSDLVVAELAPSRRTWRGILAKLGLRDRIQLIVLAYESGLVEPGGETESQD